MDVFPEVATAVMSGTAPLLTDRGRAIYLRRLVEAPAASNIVEGLDSDMIVRTEPASDASNCFGWIFAGGRGWLHTADVEAILRDNGYRAVAQPQPGDLVIYRQDREICHAGVVRVVDPGGPVIVESKWGYVDVFRHPAANCPYGESHTFHRSRRVGHELRQFRVGHVG